MTIFVTMCRQETMIIVSWCRIVFPFWRFLQNVKTKKQEEKWNIPHTRTSTQIAVSCMSLIVWPYVDHSHFLIPFVYLVLEIKVSSTTASVNQLPSDTSVTPSNSCQLPVGSDRDDSTLSDDEIASVVEGSTSMLADVRGNQGPGNEDTEKDDEFPARKQRRKGEAQRLKDNLHSGVLQSSEKRSRKKRW